MLDEIGYWTEVKLDIIRKYAEAYSIIFSAEKQKWAYHIYIDAFSGPGLDVSKRTSGLVPGSPLSAVGIDPPFKEFHFIDIERNKIRKLEELLGSRRDCFLYDKDCNELLRKEIFPTIRSDRNRRGLCFLDPYGLDIFWDTIQAAGKTRVDLFYNFSIMDANRNAFVRNPRKLTESKIETMDKVWGDRSWWDFAFREERILWGKRWKKVVKNENIAEEFRMRIQNVAGFPYVPEPFPLSNSKGSIMFYLYFASHNKKAGEIVRDIFLKAFKERNNVQPFRHRVDRDDVEPGNGLF